MRILITRPAPDAARTADKITALGHQPLVAPLLAIAPGAETCPDSAYDALVLTSANAVAPLAKAAKPEWFSTPVLAVGPRTAQGAREAGFTDVREASGYGRDLARLATQSLEPEARLLLAIARDRKIETEALLSEAGFKPTVWIAYQAEAARELPEDARLALKQGIIDAVLHYSRRSAQTFLDAAKNAGLLDQAIACRHVCLSWDVAEPLRTAGAHSVAIPARPDEDALLDLLSLNNVSEEPPPTPSTPHIGPTREPPLIDAKPLVPYQEPAMSREPGLKRRKQALLISAAAFAGAAAGAAISIIVNVFDPSTGETERRLDSLERSLTIAAPRSALELVERRQTQAAQEMASLTEKLNQTLTEASKAASDAREAMAQASLATSSIPTTAPQPAPSPDLTALQNRLSSLESILKDIRPERSLERSEVSVAPVLLTSVLQNHLQEGAPYARELIALRRLGLSEAYFQALQPFAETGAPSLDIMRRAWRELAPRLIVAKPVQPAQTNTSWGQWLNGLAAGFIRITSASAPTREVAEARISLEKALQDSNLGAAAKAWEALPETSRQASQEWGTRLKALAKAHVAAQAALSDAIGDLTMTMASTETP